MTISFLKNTGWFLVLVLLQTMVMNHICILGYAKPLVYVYLMLIIGSSSSRVALLLWGFCLGLVVDIFSNTLGFHTVTTTFIGFIRPWVLSLFMSRDNSDNSIVPGVSNFGPGKFFRYALTLVFIHHILLFVLECFSLFDWLYLLIAVPSSAMLTTLCAMAIDGISKK